MKNAVTYLILVIAVAGCASNKPILLDSPIHSQSAVTINPSLSVPEKGLHPYVGLTVGNGHPAIFDSGYIANYVGLNGGLLYQTSLEKDWAIGYFAAAHARSEYASVTFHPNRDSRKKMTEAQESAFQSAQSAYAFELGLKTGLLTKFQIGTFSLYAQGLAQYEGGDYFEFRQEVDGIGNHYNLSTDNLTFGYGLGIDLSYGKKRDWDIGLIYEIQGFFSRTQSFDSDYIDFNEGSWGSYKVNTIEGGSDLQRLVLKTELYADVKHVRVSSAFSQENLTLSCTYKW